VLAAVEAKPAAPVPAERGQPRLPLRALERGLVRPAWLRARGENTMALYVATLSIELIETLRPLVPRIKQKDKSLADQILRAASSIALNIGEGELSDPGNRRARFFSAAGSAGETLTAVKVAIAWRYFRQEEGELAIAQLRRIISILWRLTR
jgi:four helix bundle protein